MKCTGVSQKNKLLQRSRRCQDRSFIHDGDGLAQDTLYLLFNARLCCTHWKLDEQSNWRKEKLCNICNFAKWFMAALHSASSLRPRLKSRKCDSERKAFVSQIGCSQNVPFVSFRRVKQKKPSLLVALLSGSRSVKCFFLPSQCSFGDLHFLYCYSVLSSYVGRQSRSPPCPYDNDSA